MFLLLSLVVPLSAAFLIICYLWPDQGSLQSQFSIKSSFAIGLGLGISSCIFFVCLLAFGPSKVSFIVIEIPLMITLSLILLYAIKQRNLGANFEPSSELPLKWSFPSFLSASFYIAFILAMIVFILKSLNEPHGSWDAWAIWNMRARFIFRAGDKWTEAFSNLYSWSHPDYPLLIPGNVARIWSYIGSETTMVPMFLGLLFTFATVGLIVSSLSHIRSRSQGLLAGLVLLGISYFIDNGAGQLADVPLGFFILSTIVLFCLQDRVGGKCLQFVFLSGVMVGFSAWTKNEGLLFLISVIIARFVVLFPKKGWRIYLREMLSFMAGLLPILIIIVYFKTQLAPPNDLLSGQGLKLTIGRLTEFSRYLVVGKSFLVEFYGLVKVRLIVFPICLVFLGLSYEKQYKTSSCSSLIVLFLMLSGYFIVYIISPFDLEWHLHTSLKRLFLHLLPSAIFTFFLLVATPEEVGIRKGN